MNTKTGILIVVSIVITMLISACHVSITSTQEIVNFPGLESTLAVQTMVARPELIYIFISPTPTNIPTSTPIPVDKSSQSPIIQDPNSNKDTPVPSLTPIPTEKVCINAAEYIKDVTVPDYTQMKPQEIFVKTWRFENIGTCPWTEEFSIVFVSGEQMGAKSPIPIDNIVLPGEQMDISVNLIAPNSSSSYKGSWMFQDSEGNYFGLGYDSSKLFWVAVEVRQKSERFDLESRRSGDCGPRG